MRRSVFVVSFCPKIISWNVIIYNILFKFKLTNTSRICSYISTHSIKNLHILSKKLKKKTCIAKLMKIHGEKKEEISDGSFLLF